MTYEDIRKANSGIRTTDVKGKAYAEVNQRVNAFRSVCPNGCIMTEIVSLENGVVTMKATILDEEQAVLATGYAQEKESSSYINKTSFIENCETSAVGRALGLCGFGIDTSICSAEELQNAISQQEQVKKREKAAEQKDDADAQERNAGFSETVKKIEKEKSQIVQCDRCGADVDRAYAAATYHKYNKQKLCSECARKEFFAQKKS